MRQMQTGLWEKEDMLISYISSLEGKVGHIQRKGNSDKSVLLPVKTLLMKIMISRPARCTAVFNFIFFVMFDLQ